MHVRPANLSDLEPLAVMCSELWPGDGALGEHREEKRALLSGADRCVHYRKALS